MQLQRWRIIVATGVALGILVVVGFCFREPLGELFSKRWEAYQESCNEAVINSQTTRLPPVDRVEIYRIGEPGDLKSGNDFPIHPYGNVAPILASRVLTGGDAERIAGLWRSRNFGGSGAMCHEPAYAFRFRSGSMLLLETSLCWDCWNCYVRDGFGGHVWYEFHDPDMRLFQALQEFVPLEQDAAIAR